MNLARLRRRAAWALSLESFIRVAMPAAGILAAYLVAALFGLGSPWAFSAMLGLAVLAVAFRLARRRRPAPGEVDRRIERASGLRHRPIAMLEDTPESESEMSAAIWQLHQRRVAASLQAARAGRPAIDAAACDPYAMRGLLLLLLLTGAIIAGPASLPRLAGAFAFPELLFSTAGVNAWITPPAYTGAPPLVLSRGENPVVLAGSRLTLVVDGERRPVASLGGSAIGFADLAQNSFRADATLTTTAKLRIGPWWHLLAAWNLTVVPPAPPVIQMRQPIPRDHQLLIGWQAQDRYGIESLAAALMPLGHPHAQPEPFDLPLDGPNAKNATGTARPDISDSPYAGLQVAVTLTARNLAGIIGLAGPMTVTLPPAALQDKTANALAKLRQRLALEPAKTAEIGAALSRLAAAPPSQISASADLQMAVLARQLAGREIPADAAQKRLASLVRQVEEGPDYEPSRALAAANQALEQALRQAINAGKPLDNTRLQSLLAALHEALARHLQALGPSASSAPGESTIGPSDLDRMAEQIAADQAAGQTAKAQAELSRLQQILAALQSAKPMTAEQAKRAQASAQAAQQLSKLTKGESALLDQTNQGSAVPGGQAQLQSQLSATRQNLAKASINLPGLGDAATAMSTAKDALAQGNIGTASAAEGSAIQALQKAQAALASASQGMAFGESTHPSAGDNDYGDGLSGAPDEDSIPGILPSGDNPAGAIQQQIIKNDDDPALPAPVHQYYHRLLNQDPP
jgi:hypothetical protein